MNEIDLRRLDLNLLVAFDVLMAERNVTRAAERLARTQSAVSHSLARLREQVGDPLMVRVGGRMVATPFAERLVEDVRPILRSIKRVLAPPKPFDPATSTQTFRLGISDLAPSLFPRVMERVRREAPGVALDWIGEEPHTPLAVAEGQIDVALIASALSLPEGLQWQETAALEWATFARNDHPAIASWDAAAWTRWPHVQVRVGNILQSPVNEAGDGAARKRRFAARVLNFSSVAPLLARTDLLATLPVIVMHEALERFRLCALPPVHPVRRFAHRFIWSARLANDPANRWIRAILTNCFAEVLRGCDVSLSARRSIKRRSNQRTSSATPSSSSAN